MIFYNRHHTRWGCALLSSDIAQYRNTDFILFASLLNYNQEARQQNIAEIVCPTRQTVSQVSRYVKLDGFN